MIVCTPLATLCRPVLNFTELQAEVYFQIVVSVSQRAFKEEKKNPNGFTLRLIADTHSRVKEVTSPITKVELITVITNISS